MGSANAHRGNTNILLVLLLLLHLTLMLIIMLVFGAASSNDDGASTCFGSLELVMETQENTKRPLGQKFF